MLSSAPPRSEKGKVSKLQMVNVSSESLKDSLDNNYKQYSSSFCVQWDANKSCCVGEAG